MLRVTETDKDKKHWREKFRSVGFRSRQNWAGSADFVWARAASGVFLLFSETGDVAGKAGHVP